MRMSFCIPFLVLFVFGCHGGADSKKSGATAEIVSPDLKDIKDGIYVGSFKSGLVSATVELTVSDHVITKFIVRKHRCGKGRPAEAIADRVLERQTLAVDAVSGATASSRVLLKAAEIALTGERGPAQQKP